MYGQAVKRRGSFFVYLFFHAKMYEKSKLHQNKFNGHLGGQLPKAASPDHWADSRLMGTSPGEPPARHQQRVLLLPSGTSKDHIPHWSVLTAKGTTDPPCLCLIYPQPQGNLLPSLWGSSLWPSLMPSQRAAAAGFMKDFTPQQETTLQNRKVKHYIVYHHHYPFAL